MKICKMWTDGSCSPNPGNGGWSAIVEFDKKRKSFSGSEEFSTNNRMEITPLLVLLPSLIKHEVKRLEVISDSKYLMLGIENKESWQKKNVMINKDLWIPIYKIIDDSNIDIIVFWVKGHATNKENNECDRLSNEARKNIKLI
jgi:ribonuclease HI